MDQDHQKGMSSFAEWLWWLLGILLFVAAGLAIYFVVPKLESHWAKQGARPPTWAAMLISVSHFTIKYWYTIVLALILSIWLRRPTSTPPRE